MWPRDWVGVRCLIKVEPEIFYPKSLTDWRKWLEVNHLTKQSVWLVSYGKNAGKQSISWRDSVDIALCFGWIDSKKIKIDEQTTHQLFSKRKPNSTWSRINKEKVLQLIDKGLMTDAGYKTINVAKGNGSWTILDSVEQLIIPEDLETEFENHLVAKDFFESLSRSSKKAVLQWLVLARRPETRRNRIAEIVNSADQKLKPKHLR